MERGFEFLSHTADVLIKVWGESLETVFEEAAKAMFEVITDTSRVEPKNVVEISVCGYDVENLLYRWLEEMLYHHDSKNLVFGEFHVKRIYSVSNEEKMLCLDGYVKGEEFQHEKHEPRTVVKAVTYNEMRIWRENGKWYATFVVDI
ncbi:archease [Ignisphaera sp. 4213-co]|uniref:Protein archease n=1 Tax=Ignisphaera cupida TaxID=3050454 RepID=A0ABD4Z492_9CREN|nr:archease [Ignisphaera sp. 4213-co]MDK6028131.1 archease [Ignisphaera sp. 4213-co]